MYFIDFSITLGGLIIELNINYIKTKSLINKNKKRNNMYYQLQPLLALLIVISFGYAFGELARLVKLPRVVGQIFAGLLLGIGSIKYFLVTEVSAPLLQFMSEMGILLLFFFVGLQIDVKSFKGNLLEEVMVSSFDTLIPFFLGLLIFHYLFGLGWMVSLIIGICLSMSSQAVSIDVLDELNMLKTKISKIILAAGTIDDVLEIILISLIFALMHIAVGRLSTQTVLIDVLIFVILIVLLRYLIIPLLLMLFSSEKKLTYLFTGAVVITIIMALITQYLGLGAIIGALFSGILVREVLTTGKHKNVWEEHNIAKAIHIISFGLFVPVFFVWIGMNTELSILLTNTWKIIILVTISLLGTVLGSIIGVMVQHGGTIFEGVVVGWGVAPKGDVELVIATLALGKNLISPDIYSSLVLMAFFSTLIAPIIFRYLVKKMSKNPRVKTKQVQTKEKLQI